MPRSRPGGRGPRRLLACDLGLDLGTSTTLIHARGVGIVLAEPSVVATDTTRGGVVAVGYQARDMLGRAPARVRVVRPVRQGIVTDFDMTQRMLRTFVQSVQGRHRLAKPQVVACVPLGTTGIERRAVEDAVLAAGARSVHIMEEPVAAAIGAGLPIHEPGGSMIVDIGGGITEVAVISLGGVVTSQSLRIGGDQLDTAIAAHVKKEHALRIGDRTAEEVKIAIGTADPRPDEAGVELRGLDIGSGLPRTLRLSPDDVRHAIREPLDDIIDTVTAALERTPPELSTDIMDHGIVLTGGGSQLAGFDRRVADATGMDVHVADQPATSVATGAARYLHEAGRRLTA